MRIAAGGTPAFTVPAPPESFLQLAQWQTLSVSGGSSTSNCTPPHRQLPCKVVIVRAYTRAISRRDFVLSLVDALFFAAAGYELAVALGWISMGARPGEDAPGQVLVTIGALAALVLGIGATVIATWRERRPGSLPAVLVPVAAAAYMAAHFYAFDPYYLPTLRRFRHSGLSPAWVYGVTAAALLVAALIRIRPRVGLALAPLVLFVCAVSVIGMGIGH
jgi:hypothetical protein